MTNTIQESPLTTVSIAPSAPYREGLFVGDMWYEETNVEGQPKTIVAAYKWDGSRWHFHPVEHQKIAEVDLGARLERVERWIESQDTTVTKILEVGRRRAENDPNWA